MALGNVSHRWPSFALDFCCHYYIKTCVLSKCNLLLGNGFPTKNV